MNESLRHGAHMPPRHHRTAASAFKDAEYGTAFYPPRRRVVSPVDVAMSLLAVGLVAAAVLIANWGAPTDAQTEAATAASVADALAQARAERSAELRHAAAHAALQLAARADVCTGRTSSTGEVCR